MFTSRKGHIWERTGRCAIRVFQDMLVSSVIPCRFKYSFEGIDHTSAGMVLLRIRTLSSLVTLDVTTFTSPPGALSMAGNFFPSLENMSSECWMMTWKRACRSDGRGIEINREVLMRRLFLVENYAICSKRQNRIRRTLSMSPQ
jgi:hypothetical protein